MLRLFSHRNRPVSASPFPLERLQRTSIDKLTLDNSKPKALDVEAPDSPLSIRNGMREYVDIMDRMRSGPKAPKQAPIPDDIKERADHLKAASCVGDIGVVASHNDVSGSVRCVVGSDQRG